MFVDSECKTKKMDKEKPIIAPVIRELELPDLKPMDIYEEIASGPGFLLESREGEEKLSRFSFIGLKPIIQTKIDNEIKIDGDAEYIEALDIKEESTTIDKINQITTSFNHITSRIPRFDGGAVGYFSYDIVSELHKSIKRKGNPILAEFMVCRQYLVFDHKEETLYLIEITVNSDKNPEKIDKAKKRLDKLEKKLRKCKQKNREFKENTISFESNMNRYEYMEAVKKAKKHIVEGDIFQAVISRRLDVEFNGNPFNLYAALDKINPSPYMYYVDFGNQKIIGSSPEMLVRVQDGEVMTVPIAGTRKRGETDEEDRELSRELLNDEKEMAEHVMLVDLARNDLGRISKFGSVKVEEFSVIEKFSHVQHITSKVTGQLKKELGLPEVLKSCFPAGTVSGAPKIRAMEIINELEPEPRGAYAGAVGYIGFNGNMDFAIAIRTILSKKDRTSLQLGAGIVHDSKPAREWEETKEKGMAGLKAIKLAGGQE